MLRLRAGAAALAAVTLVAAGCSGSSAGGSPASTPTVSSPRASTSHIAVPAPKTQPKTRPKPKPTHTHPSTPTSDGKAPPRTHAPRPKPAPVVVIDPGHSVSVHGTDPATGLDVSDYENEPEMQDMWDVAQLVRAKLQAAGYRVLLTRSSLDAPSTLGQRAEVANRAHAALALSIHDQAGADGGIPFDSGNNHVYYQAVGDYRVTPSGKKVTFTDAHLAAVSKRYGELFVKNRIFAQGTAVNLMSNTGYDLGSRGLQSGNMWIVQLLSHVPWIYNEAGGNSNGMVGLSSSDKQVYADGLVGAVKACLPLHR